MVRVFVFAGISLVSSNFIQTIIEALIEKELGIEVGLAIWSGWAFILIGIGIYFFNNYQKKQLNKEPTFKEVHETFRFSLGVGITTHPYTKEQLQNGPIIPFNLSGHQPVKFYIEGNKLYADIEVYEALDKPPVKIIKNVLSGLPSNWDSNRNESALEIVNEKFNPVYQFIYKNDGHIIFNGLFKFPGGFVMAGDVEYTIISTSSQLPVKNLRLKRIFKYPTWKYPGKYET